MTHALSLVFEPRFEHRDLGDVYEWRERGTGRLVDYSCKYCPARASHPDDLEHNARCPIPRIGHLAECAFTTTSPKPYGGPDWPQEEGWPIRQMCVESTERAINRVLDDVE